MASSSEGEAGAHLYILRCADKSYYVGTTTAGLEQRLAQHQAGALGGYTATRRPVVLLFQQHFPSLLDAAAAERQVKGWRRDRKEALIRGDYDLLPALSRRASARRKAAAAAPSSNSHNCPSS